MGKAIENAAGKRGHQIAFVIDAGDKLEDLARADVVMEFTTPDAAFGNIKACLEAGVPVVSGTTGWLERWDEISAVCRRENGALVYASNFSVGVNLFFALNEYLAKLMQGRGYHPAILEIHHVHKKDAPSGTAVSLARQLLPYTDFDRWENRADVRDALPVESLRIGETVGFHEVKYQSETDAVTISHEAFSREGFALGALLAAEFVAGKKGIFSMRDVLQIGEKRD